MSSVPLNVENEEKSKEKDDFAKLFKDMWCCCECCLSRATYLVILLIFIIGPCLIFAFLCESLSKKFFEYEKKYSFMLFVFGVGAGICYNLFILYIWIPFYLCIVVLFKLCCCLLSLGLGSKDEKKGYKTTDLFTMPYTFVLTSIMFFGKS